MAEVIEQAGVVYDVVVKMHGSDLMVLDEKVVREAAVGIVEQFRRR